MVGRISGFLDHVFEGARHGFLGADESAIERALSLLLSVNIPTLLTIVATLQLLDESDPRSSDLVLTREGGVMDYTGEFSLLNPGLSHWEASTAPLITGEGLRQIDSILPARVDRCHIPSIPHAL